MMPSFLPGINGHPIYSETELHESTLGKRRRRAVSEPTAMDIDSEEGCQSRCSLCNGGSPSTSWPILQPNIDAFNAKDVIARSSPNTSPIYFYHRGKPFFECAYTSSRNFGLLMSLPRFTNFSLHSVEYDGKIYATAEHRAWRGHPRDIC